MSISDKPLETITLDDLQALVDSAARETGVLEFKGELPFVPTKGQPETADRWIEKGDRIGELARNEILAEIVAFANADGGTLILGMHETKDEPRCAERLAPLPNCERLAKRLADAAEDIIEPRMAAIAARAITSDEDGRGFILLRVGRSLFGPHRLTTTREFYVRRGERKSKMTAREIRDHSLNLARAGDRIASIFSDRIKTASDHFALMLKGPPQGTAPFAVIASAVPMADQHIDRLTSKPALWWRGNQFTMKLDGDDYPCAYPAREFANNPEFRLRSLIYQHDRSDGGVDRLLRSDGLVEFGLYRPWRQLGSDGQQRSKAYFGWIYSLVVGAFAQVRRVQEKLAWDAVDFGLQIAIFGVPPFTMVFQDHAYGSRSPVVKETLPLLLPTYEIAADTDLDVLLSEITSDIYNACGQHLSVKCTVPPEALEHRG